MVFYTLVISNLIFYFHIEIGLIILFFRVISSIPVIEPVKTSEIGTIPTVKKSQTKTIMTDKIEAPVIKSKEKVPETKIDESFRDSVKSKMGTFLSFAKGGLQQNLKSNSVQDESLIKSDQMQYLKSMDTLDNNGPYKIDIDDSSSDENLALEQVCSMFIVLSIYRVSRNENELCKSKGLHTSHPNIDFQF